MSKFPELIPRIFISTTSSDLRSVRKAVSDVALKHGWFPEVQEYFEMDYRTLRDSILEKIRRCSAVVHIAGFKYGAEPSELPSNAPRRSYTQMEYDIAREEGKKVYVFLCKEDFHFDSPRATDGMEGDEERGIQGKHRRDIRSRDWRYAEVSTREQIEILLGEIRQQLDEIHKAFKEEVERNARERKEFETRIKRFSPTLWVRLVILLLLAAAAASVSTPWSADFMRPALILGAVGVVTFFLSMLGFWPWFWFALSGLAFVASTVSGAVAPFHARGWTYIAAVPAGPDWQSWQCDGAETTTPGGVISTLTVRDPIRVALAARLAEFLRLPSTSLKSASINGRHYLQMPVRHAINASFADKERADVDVENLTMTGEEDIAQQALVHGFLSVQQVKLLPGENGQGENGITFNATLRFGPRYSIDQIRFQGVSKDEAWTLARAF